jgi:hypothetical protein
MIYNIGKKSEHQRSIDYLHIIENELFLKLV